MAFAKEPRSFVCTHCELDITEWIKLMEKDEDFWKDDCDEEEDEEEEDECVACGKLVIPIYEDEKGGWTIGNCLTCDAMCCRECLSKYATSEDICCVLCTPHK
jgi:hypothetical protein